MNALQRLALVNMLLKCSFPEKTEEQIAREEERATRAIAEGRLNLYEIRKQVDEAMRPFIQAEVMKVKPVICYFDENGQIKRKKELEEK